MSTSSELIQKTIAEHTVTVAAFEEACSGVIDEMAGQCIAALKEGHKVCFFGNGGSAADAQHLAAELVVRFTRNRAGLPSLAFTTDTSVITACGNDFGFEEIFARQVETFCRRGDIVVGISTSGNSPNVIKGLEIARATEVTCFAFTGAGGGRCGEISDLHLEVPSEVTARVQECHLIAGHIICDLVEIAFENTSSAISGS